MKAASLLVIVLHWVYSLGLGLLLPRRFWLPLALWAAGYVVLCWAVGRIQRGGRGRPVAGGRVYLVYKLVLAALLLACLCLTVAGREGGGSPMLFLSLVLDDLYLFWLSRRA